MAQPTKNTFILQKQNHPSEHDTLLVIHVLWLPEDTSYDDTALLLPFNVTQVSSAALEILAVYFKSDLMDFASETFLYLYRALKMRLRSQLGLCQTHKHICTNNPKFSSVIAFPLIVSFDHFCTWEFSICHQEAPQKSQDDSFIYRSALI